MVLMVGSMAIKGIFKGAGLLGGIAKTVTGFKQGEHSGKSLKTEMGRMTKSSHALRNAMAAIGIGGFTALLMSAPQLAGALAKIKMQIKLIAWAIGKHLKPLLDAIGKILQGIRTGDWSMIMEGLKEGWIAVKDLAWKTWVFIKDTYSNLWDQVLGGEEAKPQWVKDVENWVLELERIVVEKDWGAIWDLIKAPFIWMWENIDWGSILNTIATAVASQTAALAKIGEAIFDGMWAGFMNKMPDWMVGMFEAGTNMFSTGGTKEEMGRMPGLRTLAAEHGWGSGSTEQSITVNIDARGFGGSWDDPATTDKVTKAVADGLAYETEMAYP